MQKGNQDNLAEHRQEKRSFQCQYQPAYKNRKLISPVDITFILDNNGRLYYLVSNNGNNEHQLAQSLKTFDQENIEIMIANILLDRMTPQETKETPIYKIIEHNKEDIKDMYAAVREFAQKKGTATI